MRSRDLSVRETSLRLWSGNVKLVVSDNSIKCYRILKE